MTLAAVDFDYIAELLRSEAAIRLEPGKDYLVHSRLSPLARRHGLATVTELVARLRDRSDRSLRDEVIEAMTTNETSFFRDIHPFAALAERILPELMRRNAATRTITLWSAACSSGQEPYSVAMLVRDRLPELSDWHVRIIGTDISTEMVERAAAGRFTRTEVNRGLPAALRSRHFRPAGVDWQISDEIRRMVEFRALNLIDEWPFLPPVDVVLLRNVLIYFEAATKRRILDRVRRVMRPHGYLIMGGPETALNLGAGFVGVRIGRTTAYQPD